MDEADRQLLLAGKAARGLAGDAAGRIVRPVGEAPLAPGVVGQSLDHRAGLVGDDGDRAEMIGVEIAGRDRLRRRRAAPACRPWRCRPRDSRSIAASRCRDLQLGQHPEGGDVERGALGRDLLVTLVVASSRKLMVRVPCVMLGGLL